jgi:N-acetylneuraminic acid mutarotase
MWSYDIEAEVWTSEKMDGEIPVPRSGYSSCTVGDRIYIYGGEGESQLYQDLFVFDANTKTWSEITGLDLPSARKNACMACIFPNFVIFGGTTVKGYDGDLFSISLAKKTTQRLSTSDNIDSPGTRAYAQCWGYSLPNGEKEFLVANGETDGETPYSTLYTYSLSSRSW